MDQATSPSDTHRALSPTQALNRFQPPPEWVGLSTVDILVSTDRYGFKLAEFGLLVEPETASEVIESLAVFALPNTPPWLLGLSNLRGNLIPVYEPRQLLNLAPDPKPLRWTLILDEGEQALGLALSRLPEVARLKQRLAQPPALAPLLSDHVGAAYFDEGFVWLEFQHRRFFRAVAEHIAAYGRR